MRELALAIVGETKVSRELSLTNAAEARQCFTVGDGVVGHNAASDAGLFLGIDPGHVRGFEPKLIANSACGLTNRRRRFLGLDRRQHGVYAPGVRAHSGRLFDGCHSSGRVRVLCRLPGEPSQTFDVVEIGLRFGRSALGGDSESRNANKRRSNHGASLRRRW
jgi:hypothetical protein